MVKLKRLVVAAGLLAASISNSAIAAISTYNFSGELTLASQVNGSSNPDWVFAEGQTFSGTIGYDPDKVVSSNDLVNDPDWILSDYFSPITSFSYKITTSNGIYSYSVPVQDLVGVAVSHALVGSGSGGWNGVLLRTFNYPVGWTAGPPSNPVPGSAYVGSYYPHESSFSLLTGPGVMSNSGANQDLAALYKQAGPNGSATLSVRFSDPGLWESNLERVDGILQGRVTSFSLASAVPEPSTWLTMIFGIGMIGFSLRRRGSFNHYSAARA